MQAKKFEWRSETGVGGERDELLHTCMDSFLGSNHLHFYCFVLLINLCQPVFFFYLINDAIKAQMG